MSDAKTLLKKINILVVDDMEAIRGMIKATLRDLGLENIDLAINGQDAWKRLNNKPYHMIICDWDMPKMSGIELLETVRASEDHKHLPFLLLTASTEKSRVITAVEAGVDDYLTKPFQSKQLHFRLLKLLPKVKIGKDS